MTDEKRLTKEVNRLYWETDASVADIADRLDISRRALYDAVEPAPAGMPCPTCGADLGYRNRTARDRRNAECAACGAETSVSASTAPPRRPEPAPTGAPPETEALDTGRALLIGGAVLTGIAVGALIGLIGRRS